MKEHVKDHYQRYTSGRLSHHVVFSWNSNGSRGASPARDKVVCRACAKKLTGEDEPYRHARATGYSKCQECGSDFGWLPGARERAEREKQKERREFEARIKAMQLAQA